MATSSATTCPMRCRPTSPSAPASRSSSLPTRWYATASMGLAIVSVRYRTQHHLRWRPQPVRPKDAIWLRIRGPLGRRSWTCKLAANAAKFEGSKGLRCLGRSRRSGGGFLASSRLRQGTTCRGMASLRVPTAPLRLGRAQALPSIATSSGRVGTLGCLAQWRFRQHAHLLAGAAACLAKRRLR